MVISKWLPTLTSAPAGKVAILELADAEVIRNDVENLPALLRYMRNCRALVVAKVPKDASRLRWLDLVVCLCADMVVADENKDGCPIDFPALGEPEEAVVKAMWADAVGVPSFEDTDSPDTLLQLRKAHLLSTEKELQAISSHRTYMMPEYLVGLRRVGAHRMKKMDKRGYNFYWVTKCFTLNALPSSDSEFTKDCSENAGGLLPPPIIVAFDESSGVLKVDLRPEIIDASSSEIVNILSPWLKKKTKSADGKVPKPSVQQSSVSQVNKSDSVFGAVSSWFTRNGAVVIVIILCLGVLCRLVGCGIVSDDTSPTSLTSMGELLSMAFCIIASAVFLNFCSGSDNKDCKALSNDSAVAKELNDPSSPTESDSLKRRPSIRDFWTTDPDSPKRRPSIGDVLSRRNSVNMSLSFMNMNQTQSQINLNREIVQSQQEQKNSQPQGVDKTIARIDITLVGGSPSWLHRVVPAEASRKGGSAYKWYRKWEGLLTQLFKIAPIQCELQGPTVPALLELFFSSNVRIWSWSDAAEIGFQGSGFMPGATFFQAQRHLGRAALKKLLLQGFTPALALKMGVVTRIKNGSIEQDVECEQCRPELPSISPILSLLQHRCTSLALAQPKMVDQLPNIANIVGLGLSLPGSKHELTQKQICTRLGLSGTPLGGLFDADHIQTRSVAQINEPGFGFIKPGETKCDDDSLALPGQGVLTNKHLRWARAMLIDAVVAACQDAGQPVSAVRYISVCSSSGYLLPGLSAYVVHDLQLSHKTIRCDIVGMGCHAGLNSLQAAANWAALHPGELAISCGVEVLTAHYMWKHNKEQSNEDPKNRLNNALCNSLFSDGCFAAAVMKPAANGTSLPYYATLHEFHSLTATSRMDTMTYQWDDVANQFWFQLSEEAPYVVGGGLLQLLRDQQDRGMPVEHVQHYVLHTGGQTVIDSAAAALGLDDNELDPTRIALRKFGNNSSVSFMFAYSEFLESSPAPVTEGDLGLFITMGPGCGLELGLWSAGPRSASHSQPVLRRVADPPLAAGIPGTASIKFGVESAA
jgi:predicted naringenin-chalcone synthase